MIAAALCGLGLFGANWPYGRYCRVENNTLVVCGGIGAHGIRDGVAHGGGFPATCGLAGRVPRSKSIAESTRRPGAVDPHGGRQSIQTCV